MADKDMLIKTWDILTKEKLETEGDEPYTAEKIVGDLFRIERLYASAEGAATSFAINSTADKIDDDIDIETVNLAKRYQEVVRQIGSGKLIPVAYKIGEKLGLSKEVMDSLRDKTFLEIGK